MVWQHKYYEGNVGVFGWRSIWWIMSRTDGRQIGKLFFLSKMLNCWFIVYSNAIMKSKQLDFKSKNQELLKLKLKLMFDFSIGMEYHLKPEIKMLLNNQLQFLDGLEWHSEGKPLQVNDSFEDVEESSKDYILHSWLTLLWNDNYSNKHICVMADFPPLWRLRTSQSKAAYLYDDKSKEGEWWFWWL